MNRKGGKSTQSNLPIATFSRGNPANGAAISDEANSTSNLKLTKSAEDIPKQIGSSISLVGGPRGHAGPTGIRRAVSPGEFRRRSLLSSVRPRSQASVPSQHPGVRYITEDLIKKIAKEENFELIVSLNLTLSKEGGKKIKYIENLDRLRKLQILNLSYNFIEKMERLDKLLRLQDLNLSHNMITKIEGIENLGLLQTLNLNDNKIEHIPKWFSKKLKSLRVFKIARNKLTSLSEVSKLKILPDIIQLEVVGNPLCDLSHSRLYIIFHLRSVENLDNQMVNEKERKQAQERFALDEVEQLEKKLEEGEMKYKLLEDSHSKSLQEKSQHESSQHQLLSKEKDLMEKVKKLEQELAAKDELLKKKTSDLNKASQKHYQLEQELAFHKIDSKFDSLTDAPHLAADSHDDSSDLQESAYIGRARFRMNQHAQEINIVPKAKKAQLHSIQPSSGVLHRVMSEPLNQKTQEDHELEKKQIELKKTEERLRVLQLDLSNTEKKLLNATSELKKIATDRFTPEPFREDNKYKIRHRLARKMQRVNELRNSATQMESEIDRKNVQITKDKNDLQKLKLHLTELDPRSQTYETKMKEMHDKETQINVASQRQQELEKELEEAIGNIAAETADIKNLEKQLSTDQIEQNEELRQELDDIVSGLSGYLENVKGQSEHHKHEVERLVEEKRGMEEKIRRMESDLHKLETESNNARLMQKRLTELEDSLRKTEDLNSTLQDQVNRTKLNDPELQDKLQRAENEAKQLRQTLIDTEKKTEIEKKAMQKQLLIERERAEKMTQKIQDVNRQELESKKLVQQLEAAKALNAGLRDQVEEYKQKQQEDGFKPSDLKKRLKKFTHEFKNMDPIQPQNKNDVLGFAFQELQKHAQEQINTSTKEMESLKKYKQKADAQIQALKEQIQHTEAAIQADKDVNGSKLEEENKKLQDELKRLKRALDEAKKNQEGSIPVRIVYRPDTDSDRASSMNSDEKLLFDVLQKDLMDLKRHMRNHENDLSKKLTEAEKEAAHWRDEAHQKEREYETEMEEYRQALDLMREKQEARIQVIAQDLDQAQFVAESLQKMLEDRERVLNEEFSNADMSNQLISAQEDELEKLYDILDKQREEIEKLNQMLDNLAQQGPDGVGAAFDDELWRIRQEVNSLKETLAMQSAYVQAMPNVGEMATQADAFFQYGPADQSPGFAVRTAGAAAGTPVAGHQNYDSVPTPPSKVSGSQVTTVGSTTHTSANANFGTSSRSSHSGNRPGSVHISGGNIASTVPFKSNQRLGQMSEHLGTERRESKAPPGGKSAVSRAADGLPSQTTPKTRVLGIETNAAVPQQTYGPHNRQNSRGQPLAASSAFEPVRRAEDFHQTQSFPQASAPHIPSGSAPHLPPGSAPHLPPGSAHHLPPGSAPHLPPGSAHHIPPGSAPHLPPGSAPHIPPGSAPHLPPGSAPHLPPGSAPHLPPGSAPHLPPGSAHHIPPGSAPHLPPGSAPHIPPGSAPHLPPGSAPHLPPGSAPHLPPREVPGQLPSSHHTAVGPLSHVDYPPQVPYGLSSLGPSQASQTSRPYGVYRDTNPQALPMFYPVDNPTRLMPSQHAMGPTYPASSAISAAGQPVAGNPTVAFNPVPVQIWYNPGSVDGSTGIEPYTLGHQSYQPSGPAQLSSYGPGRMYVPAGTGHRGQHPARIYYPAQQSFPMPAPGGAPPPPPPGGFVHVLPGDPRSSAMTPVASGTPIRGGDPPIAYYDGSMLAPPSPIRAASMDVHPRGILKNGGEDQGEDSYLFCNVPEHHDLEDYITELQETIRKLKLRLSKEKEFQEETAEHEDKKMIKKLLHELKDRRSELEGLDLAIERQKRNLWEMKKDESDLRREKKKAHSELNYLRKKNDKKVFIRHKRALDDSFIEEIERYRLKHITDELHCLQKTLAKRQAQLKEAERNLKECNSELREAKDQTRETVKRYDDVTSSLHQAIQEHQEIEKRSNDVAVELVKASEQLAILRADVKDIDHKRSRQEKILRDINRIISKKDKEFQEVNTKVKSATESLQRLEADVIIHSQREKEMVEAMRDSEDVIAKRRAEIQRMKDQIEQSRHELEKLDQQIGRKKTELQLVHETQERKQQEYNNMLQDIEADITAKHREIKDCREDIDNLNHQKADLSAHIKTKRGELQKVKEDIEQEEEVLQHLMNNVNKNKSELKHTYEMQQMEQTELENVKAQHSQKMVELEKTHRALLEGKNDLEQLNADISRKSAEVERLRQTIERDRLEVDQLKSEKQSLDDRIATLVRERDMLDESCKNLDDRINNMKRNQRIMEEKMDSTGSRLEMLEAELRIREREMEDADIQKEIMQKDIHTLKETVKEKKQELKSLNSTIREAEEQMRGIEQDVKHTFHQRDEAKQELERLNEQIRQSSNALEDHVQQEKGKLKELQELLRILSEHEGEHQEVTTILNKLRKEVEREENKLNRLVSNANSDLQAVRDELTLKEEELKAMRDEYNELQKKCDELQYNEAKFKELNRTCQNLEEDLKEHKLEKSELTKALSASYEETQRLHKETSIMQEKMAKERAEFENALKDLQLNLEQAKQEVKQVEHRSSNQVAELQSLAEKHFNRANSLEAELLQTKKEVSVTKKQLISQECLTKRLDAMYEALNWSQEDVEEIFQPTLQAKDAKSDHQTLPTQINKSDRSLENKENLATEIKHFPTFTPLIPDPGFQFERKMKDTLKERLAEEQDYLRFQLKQQVQRHTETMESARIKSEETIDCLRRKLNALQEVLFNKNPGTAVRIQNLASPRQRSPAYQRDLQDGKGRTRSPSPLNRSGRSYLTQRRSRSSDSLDNSLNLERGFH
ncbi:centriolin-like isoform X2 [Physella acuta]|uniref:centriolin-like isoform X2 n=1 Tax=Physella acuta TaxID=109671 RepID=UPI0027DD24FD|nr:centriolin-like isoform X2 [Physella acuta]